MLATFLATMLGMALGYVLYKTFFEALRTTVQTRAGEWLEQRKHRRELRRTTVYRLLQE